MKTSRVVTFRKADLHKIKWRVSNSDERIKRILNEDIIMNMKYLPLVDELKKRNLPRNMRRDDLRKLLQSYWLEHESCGEGERRRRNERFDDDEPGPSRHGGCMSV